MNKTPYFYRNDDGSFEFYGYLAAHEVARAAPEGPFARKLVDASFLYRTVTKANEALNTMPLPEGCTK